MPQPIPEITGATSAGYWRSPSQPPGSGRGSWQVDLEGHDVTGPGVDGQIMGVAVDEAGQDQTAAHVVGTRRPEGAGEFKGVIAAHKADLPVFYHQALASG